MKVQLIVVQGKPEGKVIPLMGPTFKIGRGETCHLRPTSEQVSREHAEFSVTADKVTLKDLGSRNGTLVNGKALTEACVLKDRDLVQIGLLTFAIAIESEPASAVAAAPAAAAPAKAAAKAASPDDVSQHEIESWLVADEANQLPERPSGVYGGETITIEAFKDASSPAPKQSPAPAAPAATKPAPAAPAPAPAPAAAKPAPVAPAPVPAPAAVTPAAVTPAPAAPAPAPAPAPPKPTPVPAPPPIDPDDVEYERLPEGEGDVEELADSEEMDDDADEEGVAEEYVDESNPFYVKKAKAPEGPAKPSFKDTSDAASDILRRLMDKRRSSK